MTFKTNDSNYSRSGFMMNVVRLFAEPTKHDRKAAELFSNISLFEEPDTASDPSKTNNEPPSISGLF